MELALDNATWDLHLDKTGNIAVLEESKYSELLSQRIKHRLQTFKGECFLDREVGVPYFEEITRKNPELGKVRSLLASVIQGVEGVSKILSLDLNFNARSRELKVKFKVQSGSGSLATGEI